MREIKFRGMDYKGEWHIGDLAVTKTDFNGHDIGCYISNAAGRPLTYKVIADTIGQLTNLKDKNGTEIYEGDIFDIHQTVNGCSTFVLLSCIGCYDIRYYQNETIGRKYEYSIYELIDLGKTISEKKIEVIGNIHESQDSKLMNVKI